MDILKHMQNLKQKGLIGRGEIPLLMILMQKEKIIEKIMDYSRNTIIL